MRTDVRKSAPSGVGIWPSLGCTRQALVSMNLVLVCSTCLLTSGLLLADHAEQAAECGLAVQLAASRFCGQQRHAKVDGVRIGIHSGDVVFGVLGAGPAPGRLDVFGETVSVAVRMAECAPTDSIIVSKSTHSRIQ
eukprot:COSAG02_NODE_39409_length_417_cov_1.138365_1_plen_135_part_10